MVCMGKGLQGRYGGEMDKLIALMLIFIYMAGGIIAMTVVLLAILYIAAFIINAIARLIRGR